MKKALYPLRRRIAGFDFFCWLVLQKAAGYEHVVFDPSFPKTDKFTLEEVKRRYESILKPGPALFGMTMSEGSDGDQTSGGQKELVDFVKAGGEIPRLKSVLPPKNVEYTVTLRNTRRWPNRNSRHHDWLPFAEEIGAKVIQDYDVEPIHLHERMAYYAGAKMNFFDTNGPIMPCFLSEYPAMGFDVQNSPMIPIGIPMGVPYPYLLPDRHYQIYEPSTLENLRKHFKAWKERTK